MVESPDRRVWKLCTGLPSASVLVLAFFRASFERRAGITVSYHGGFLETGHQKAVVPRFSLGAT